MASLPSDSLAGLEVQRLQLEENVAKLNKALRHWQTCEAEYEALREQIRTLPPEATRTDLVLAARSIEGGIVTENDINEILGHDKSNKRTVEQIDSLIARRVEYVQRNVESLQKQCDAAELALADAPISSRPDSLPDQSLPLTEIYEELDDEGNVISSRISHPGDATPQLLEVLKKAGVKDEDFVGERNVNEASTNLADMNSIVTHAEEKPKPRKKSVSFAEGTKEATEEEPTTKVAIQLANKSNPFNQGSTLAKGLLSSKNRIIEVNDNDEPISLVSPVIPTNESPEDAALRREMLQYSMSEVGSVVAQLDLDEGGSQGSYSDNEEEGDDDMESATSIDDEDQYGMSTNREVGDDYKNEMLALEKKLNARMFENVGPASATDQFRPGTKFINHAGGEGDHDLGQKSNFFAVEAKSKEKSVRFSERLDVAPILESEPSPEPSQQASPMYPATAVRETIVERPLIASQAKSIQPGKPSRFKIARNAASTSPENYSPSTNNRSPPHLPSPNVFGPIASRIVERPPTNPKASARPSSPDEFDPALIRQQVATEYYRQRNRLVQKEGGFSRQRQQEQEMEDVGAEEAEEGIGGKGDGEEDDDWTQDLEPPRKVSLFKAARLKGSGAR